MDRKWPIFWNKLKTLFTFYIQLKKAGKTSVVHDTNSLNINENCERKPLSGKDQSCDGSKWRNSPKWVFPSFSVAIYQIFDAEQDGQLSCDALGDLTEARTGLIFVLLVSLHPNISFVWGFRNGVWWNEPWKSFDLSWSASPSQGTIDGHWFTPEGQLNNTIPSLIQSYS